MAASMRIALLAVAAMAAFSAASAATYNVGEPDAAWDLGVDYGTWVSSKKFHPGDTIVFKYSPQAHDVVEVSKAGYDSCSASNAITTLKTGNDVITLSATGTRYFICSIPRHCTPTGTGTMRIAIDVVEGSSPSSPEPAASGPSDSNSPPPPPMPSAATSVRATAGLAGLVVLLAGLMA